MGPLSSDSHVRIPGGMRVDRLLAERYQRILRSWAWHRKQPGFIVGGELPFTVELVIPDWRGLSKSSAWASFSSVLADARYRRPPFAQSQRYDEPLRIEFVDGPG
jgi:hypothetical protein